MKCIIPSQNVKIVARAIHSLSKIGDELYLEPTSNDLVFCSVSSAQSALCEFKMCRSFFSSYNFSVDDNNIKCKVAMKSCLGVFKNPHCADKQVESCEIRFKSEGNVVIFYIKYTNSSTKKFFLPIIDSEKVEANYDKDAPNRIVASSKLLASSFKNFRSNEDEITIKVSGDKIVIKNHLEPGRDKGLMRTELSFQPSEFDCCTVNSATSVTFTLREMKAAINFAEPANLPLTINITKPGDPLVLKVAFYPAYESTYIISTLRASRMDLEASSHISEGSSVPSRPIGSRQTDVPMREMIHADVHAEPGLSTSRLNSRSVNVQPDGDVTLGAAMEVDECQVNINSSKHVSASNKLFNAHQTSSKEINTKSHVEQQSMDVDDNLNINIELINKIFQRCFTRNYILNSVPGHDVILIEPSDSE